MRRRDRASFRPEVLQAVAVKGLIQYCCTVLNYVFYDCLQYLERRFKSRAARLTGTVILLVQQVKYFGIRSTPVLPQ